MSKHEGVVLLHGIGRTRYSMAGLAWYLRQHGYEVLNITYPSRRYELTQLAGIIDAKVRPFSRRVSVVHFIGHSMGGLLIRAYLARFRPTNLGRVVMLGTPNGGSEWADMLKDFFLYKKLYGPAGQQLVTNRRSLEHILGKVDYELGVIAGNFVFDPISARIIGKPNDGLVSVLSTRLKGMKAHRILPINHLFLPMHRQVWRQAEHFLKEGRFQMVERCWKSGGTSPS